MEAGVDVSARTLITELAPWPSLVQRFGRCNRRGEFNDGQPAQIFWVDVLAKDDKQASPYTKSEMDLARENLRARVDGGLNSLHDFFQALSDEKRTRLFPFDPPHVIRSKDFVDLFDTTPDLAGNDIDISRFIREGDDVDVQVFWRQSHLQPLFWSRGRPDGLHRSGRNCVRFRSAHFGDFLERAGKVAYLWDALDGRWARANSAAVFPGQLLWIPTDEGGYSRNVGWDPRVPWDEGLRSYVPPEEFDASSVWTSEPEYDSDLLSQFGWQSIAKHTSEVVAELGEIERRVKLGGIPWKALRLRAPLARLGKGAFGFSECYQGGVGN